MKKATILILLITFLSGCKQDHDKDDHRELDKESQTLFSTISPTHSGVTFQNKIIQKNGLSFLNYDYVYMGAGVVVIDYNNDGLEDLYFVSTFGANKLYKNLGDMRFEDVSTISKTEDPYGFSTGAVAFDANNDGYLDIYVCKAGSLNDSEGRKNKLFINQKNGTFSERAKEYGLDHSGYSTQAYPLDYDKDGDLDLFILNHRNDFDNVINLKEDFQNSYINETSDHLFRNDNGTFTQVTKEANVTSRSWGLSAITSDFNTDDWVDFFVCNDFWQPDYYYLNNQKGAFTNFANSHFKHISQSSMGSDAADLNNDLQPDLITVDMMSNDYKRSKENMASMSIENFRNLTKIGYHNQYSSNMLFHNKGYGYFTEIGQYSGITKTDWSWSALLADFDNDGLKDIYITNGVERDYNNQDTRKKLDSISALGKSVVLEDILNLYPSEPLVNHVYKNKGAFRFEPKMKDWGLTDKTFSNGAVYVDLDNDGDLEIVTNNINDNASIYQNNAANNYIQFKISGSKENPFALGTKIYIESKLGKQMLELYGARGYLSSVSSILNFGLGNDEKVEKATIVWPNGQTTSLDNPKINTTIQLDFNKAQTIATAFQPQATFNKKVINSNDVGISYIHKENDFDDYKIQLLLPQKQSTKGTGIAVGDVNNDGLDDFFVGNALGSTPELYIQSSTGMFTSSNINFWKNEAKYEDSDALFFDADNDGDLDLYVVSGGYELTENDPLLQDRLYLNNGKGDFKKSTGKLPKMLSSGKTVVAADVDNDNDLDLFVGGGVLSRQYPLASPSYLLKNDKGSFTVIANPDMLDLGITSSALFTDYDGDDDKDLMVVGEWMTPILYENNDGTFTKTDTETFNDKEGWWFAIAEEDFDNDGDIDYVFGNLGTNNKFHPSAKKPLFINAKDFDENGSFDVAMSKINDGKMVPVRGKECSSEQNPFLLDKIKTYKEFANLDMESIYGKDKLQDAFRYDVKTFETLYCENLGNGTFKTKPLPSIAQFGPTLSFTISDFNNDGNKDIMGIGAIYDAEVETIRYDSNFGYVLLGNGKGAFSPAEDFTPFIVSDAKDSSKLIINGIEHYIVVSNNAPLELFSFN